MPSRTLDRQLLDAARLERWSEMRDLLPKVRQVRAHDALGGNALSYLVNHRQNLDGLPSEMTEIARQMVAKNPALITSVDDKHRRSALLLACMWGHHEVVEVMMSALENHPTFNVNAQDSNGHTGLHLAAMNGHLKIVQRLLAHPDIQPNMIDEEGRHALLAAAEEGCMEVVEALIPVSEVDLAQPEHGGRTALFAAAGGYDLPTMEVLLDAGAATSVVLTYPHRKPIQRNALHALAFGSNTILPVITSDLPAMVERLTTVIDPLTPDDEGYTPLMVAVQRFKVGAIEALLPLCGDYEQHRTPLKEGLLDLAMRSTAMATIKPENLHIWDDIALRAPTQDVLARIAAFEWDHAMILEALPRWFRQHEAQQLQAVTAKSPMLEGKKVGRPRL